MSEATIRAHSDGGYYWPPEEVAKAKERLSMARQFLRRSAEISRTPICPVTSRLASLDLSKAHDNIRQAAAHLLPRSPSGRVVDITQDRHARITWERVCADMGIPKAYCR